MSCLVLERSASTASRRERRWSFSLVCLVRVCWREEFWELSCSTRFWSCSTMATVALSAEETGTEAREGEEGGCDERSEEHEYCCF